ncbi:MAG: hypothetical protein WKF73_12365 [Nocardioidaceae bacterium]
MTVEERRDFPNLMLLCPNHHRLIDALEAAAHPTDHLLAMKANHEEHCVNNRWWLSGEELDHRYGPGPWPKHGIGHQLQHRWHRPTSRG